MKNINEVYKSKLDIDLTCLALSILLAHARSKDPHTKVGAIVYDEVTGGIFLGYNGFPSGFADSVSLWDCRLNFLPNDENSIKSKYSYVVHAEVNAVRKALQALGENVSRCTLYCTNYPCVNCFRDAVMSTGIREIHYLHRYPVQPAVEEMNKQYQATLIQHDFNEIMDLLKEVFNEIQVQNKPL